MREAGILEVLLLRAGRAVTKEQLMEGLCAWDSDISLNAIEVYVHRLRKKLEPAGIQVRTFRGPWLLHRQTRRQWHRQTDQRT